MLRVASRNLNPEEFGLWGFITQSVGYILLLDLGVSSSLGRIFGDPLADQDPRRFHAWFTLAIVILATQGCLIIGVGLMIETWVLNWFQIPTHLAHKASILWRTCLIISGLGLPLRVSNALLFAQNRAYLSNLSPILSSWISLLSFYIMIERGAGVFSYAWSTAIGAAAGWAMGLLCIAFGPTSLGINFRDIQWPMLRKLFDFASAVFLVGIAVQVFFAGQGLIITKILGLEMAAIFAVTTRIPLLLMQMIWKPFDSFTPRWQIEYCQGNVEMISREFRLVTDCTILLAGAAGCFVILALPSFICLWTRPEYFGGSLLLILLAIFILEQNVLHCASYPFTLTMKMKTYSKVILLHTIASLAVMIYLIRWMGLPGAFVGAIFVSLLFSFWYHIRAGFALLSHDLLVALRPSFLLSLFSIITSAFILLLFSSFFIKHGIFSLLLGCLIAFTISSPLFIKIFKILRSCQIIKFV
jgi:O-antigen/teichoic acid export membrane protein